MGRILTSLLAVVAVLATAGPVRAETYRFVAPDGTVHLTNAPTDPRYQRMGLGAAPTPVTFRFPGAVAAGPYTREIREAAHRHGLPEGLLAAVIRVESGFNPRAVSRKGARGLMQLMPDTAALLGVRNSFDPLENIDGGARYLRGLLERLQDLPLALAAYNAGEQAVLGYGGIPPYPETQDYVVRVLQLFPGREGGRLPGATYRSVARDGTIIYTNIPPRPRL